MAGDAHGIALKGDGTVLAWGANSSGQVGDGTTTQRLSPTAVSALTSLSAVAAGNGFLARRETGRHRVVVGRQRLCAARRRHHDRSLVAGPGRRHLRRRSKIAAGDTHALALLADGTVVGWGRNAEGQIGDGTVTQRTTPVEVALLSDVMAIAAGGSFSLALKDDGSVWSWGDNAQGQLGNGTTTDRSSPDQVAGLSDIVQIAAGK